MRTRKLILAILLLLPVVHLQAQNTFRVNYQIAVPMGEVEGFINEASYRGFSFEYYNEISDGVHLGLEAGWNFFHKEYPRQTYEFDFGAVNMRQWRYKHVVPITANVLLDSWETKMVHFYWKFGLGVYWVNDEVWEGLSVIRHDNAYFGMIPGFGLTVGPGRFAGMNLAVEYPFIVNGQMLSEGRGHAHYWNFKFGISLGRNDY